MVSASAGPDFSRRSFLKGMGLGALALGMAGRVGAGVARAQASTMEAAAFYRFPVGDYQVTVIQDGIFGFPPDFYAANVEPGSVAALLEEHNLPVPEVLLGPFNVVLVQAGSRVVLLDTGFGGLSLDPNAPPPAVNCCQRLICSAWPLTM